MQQLESTALRPMPYSFVLTVLVLVSLSCAPNPTQRSAGDGILHDKGAFTYYPRFRLELPETNLSQHDKVTFIASDLPDTSWSVYLAIKTDQGLNLDRTEWNTLWDELDHTGTAATLEVVGINGRRVGVGGLLTDAWDPGAMATEKTFHKTDLFRLALGSQVTIVLDMSAKNSSSLDLSGYVIKPILLGGGIES